ncbi:UNVERIFIED_CONTAM: hypothetical protein HDU68_001173 [Siphonaria sp. JEL0065]|nr:hypothetical protein HDU68_001173 [Siphonaria sp. JEL0065]
MATTADTIEGFNLTLAQKIVKGKDLKEQGNAEFKTAGVDASKLQKAMRLYHESINYLSGLDSSQFTAMMPGAKTEKLLDTQKAEIDDTVVACYNNMAACQVKLQRWDRVIANTNQVLKKQPTNAKALYRRGMAQLNLNELSKAEADLNQALDLAPGDVGIKTEIAKLKKIYKAYEDKQKQEWKGKKMCPSQEPLQIPPMVNRYSFNVQLKYPTKPSMATPASASDSWVESLSPPGDVGSV